MSEVREQDALMHHWHIEPREYARHEERRGTRFAYQSLNLQKTALLVVDMVPFFITDNPYCRGILPNIRTLAEALRDAGGKVVWVLPAGGEPTRWAREFYGEKVARLYAASGGEGTVETRLQPYFQVHPQDVVVEKSAASAFFPGHSPLHGLLDAQGIDTVVVTGTVTNVCCESTARDAATLGYRVIMVADANAARRDEDHNASLYTIYRTFGDVRTTQEVLAMIAEA